MPQQIPIELDSGGRTTALLYSAAPARLAGVTLLLGHGAGAGQTSDFMVQFAVALAERGIDAATFNFLYTEQGRRAPDGNEQLQTCYRAAIAAIARHESLEPNKLAIGGKSMGGRIASLVAASGAGLKDKVAGLVFLGYPLHPPGNPLQLRDRHLPLIGRPMLFVQGERDPFGTPSELKSILEKLEPPGALYIIEGGDHSFKIPKSATRSLGQVFASAQDEIARWLRNLP